LIVLGPPGVPVERLAVHKTLELLLHNDRNNVVQIWTRVALMRMDKPSEQHLDAIAKFLKNTDANLRTNAARALGSIGREAKTQVSELLRASNVEQDLTTLFWMIDSLGHIGQGALPAVPELKTFLTHKEPAIKEAAAWAIREIEGKPAK